MDERNIHNSEEQPLTDEALIQKKIAWVKTLWKQESKLNDLAGHGYGLRAPDYEARTAAASAESQAIEFPTTTTITGPDGRNYEFAVEKGVLNPEFFSISKRVAKDFPYDEVSDKEVLEIGSGIGAQMILIAEAGASKVVGVEINPEAVKAAQQNIETYDLGNKAVVREGSMFDTINENEKFSAIYFHAPYFFSSVQSEPTINGRYTDAPELQEAMYDRDYGALVRFIYEGREHLAEDGFLLLLYSDRINGDVVRELVGDAGLESESLQKYQSQTQSEPLSFELLKIKIKR